MLSGFARAALRHGIPTIRSYTPLLRQLPTKTLLQSRPQSLTHPTTLLAAASITLATTNVATIDEYTDDGYPNPFADPLAALEGKDSETDPFYTSEPDEYTLTQQELGQIYLDSTLKKRNKQDRIVAQTGEKLASFDFHLYGENMIKDENPYHVHYNPLAPGNDRYDLTSSTGVGESPDDDQTEPEEEEFDGVNFSNDPVKRLAQEKEFVAEQTVLRLTHNGNPAVPTLINGDSMSKYPGRRQLLKNIGAGVLTNLPIPEYEEHRPRFAVKMIIRKIIHDLNLGSMYIVPLALNLSMVNSAIILYNREMGANDLIPEVSLHKLGNLQRTFLERYLITIPHADDVEICPENELRGRYDGLYQIATQTNNDLAVFNLINHAVHVNHREHPIEFIQDTLKRQSRYIAGRRRYLLEKARADPEFQSLSQPAREKYIIDLLNIDNANVANEFDRQKIHEQQRWIDIRTAQDREIAKHRERVSSMYRKVVEDERLKIQRQNIETLKRENRMIKRKRKKRKSEEPDNSFSEMDQYDQNESHQDHMASLYLEPSSAEYNEVLESNITQRVVEMTSELRNEFHRQQNIENSHYKQHSATHNPGVMSAAQTEHSLSESIGQTREQYSPRNSQLSINDDDGFFDDNDEHYLQQLSNSEQRM